MKMKQGIIMKRIIFFLLSLVVVTSRMANSCATCIGIPDRTSLPFFATAYPEDQLFSKITSPVERETDDENQFATED